MRSAPGEISFDVAKAYAATPDAERQAFVFEQVNQSYMSSHPDSIRRMMTQATVSASDRRARFVGEEDYVAAGGRIERDLFADADEARWLDVALLERLAAEKLETLAAETAAEQGLAFVRPTLDSWVGYPATEGLRRVPVEKPPLTHEESARVEDLEEQIGELVGLLEDEETEDSVRADAEEKIRALDLEGLVSADPLVLTLRRFLAIARHGRFASSLHPREHRARRWILMLRAWDAVAAGANQRQIADILLRGSAGEPRWRSREPSLRSQAQRLVRAARDFAQGGYRVLLQSRGGSPRMGTLPGQSR